LTNITASQAGTYSVIATLGNCPSLTGTFTILVNQLPPTPTATSNSPICAGASINLNTSTQTGFNYVWTGPNGFNSAMQNPTLNNATSAMAGTYSLTVTNQSTGCTSIAGTTLVVINLLPPTPQATSNTPICTGNTINLSTSTTGTLNYTWNGPNSFNSIIQNPSIVNATSAMAGTYSLTVTNTATGCTSSIATTIVVINQTPITPTVSSNSAICTGQTLSLQSGSTTGSSYSWTGPNAFTSTQQNPSLVNTTTAQSGTYTVTATLVGCSSQQSLISVIINPLPPTPIATSNSPLCEGNTINFNTTTIGVNYVWLGPNSFSSTSQNPSLINATTAMSGTYSLTITNIATGCTSLIGTTQVVVNTTPTTPTITSNAPICVGASLSLNANSTANTAYNWIGPNGFTSVTQNNNLTNVTLNQAGTYTVIATLGNCPSALSTFTVAINPLPPTPGAINNTPICIGSPINLSTTATGVNYNWIGPNSFSNSTQNPTIGTSALVNAGTYSLTVTNTITGCTSLVGTTLVVINPLPATPVALSNSALCAGDTLLLSTAPLSNTNYSWSGPLGFTSSTQNPVILNSTIPMSGTYSVTITNTTTGCTSNSGIVNVIVNVIPTILSVGNTSPICENASVSFSVTPVLGANYHWNGPNAYNSNIQNPTINNINLNNAGVYTVYATLGSCSSATFSTTVNVNALPATPIATSNSTICIGNSLNLSTGNLNGFTYQWNGPNAFISSLQNPTISNAQLANAGTYSLTVTEINTGCSSIVGTTLAVINSLPTISISSNSPVCEGASINLTSNSSTNVIYNWSGPNSFTSNIQNPNIANATLAMSGTYSATVLDNITGCTSLLSTTNVIVNQTPTTPNATSNSAICAGQALNLQANSSVGASYTWIGPNAFNSNIQNPIINNATIIQAGTYTVGAFIGNCFSPVATVTVTINALPSTIIITSNAPLCVGDTLSLSSTLVNGVTYSWSGPNGFASNIQNPSISNTSLAMSGIYSLSITNTVTGCNSIPASSNILINTLPATPTISTNSPVCYGDSLLLVSNTVGNYSYSWVGPNGYSSTFSNNLILNFGDNNVGDYTLFITNNNTSCKSATAITTVLLDCPDIEDLLIPNVFTPNGDNTNELFTIETKQLKSIEGEIYDRWGIKMYAWDSLKEAWNGKTKNGSDAPEGTYYYIINATTFKGKKLTTKGSLMLLR
jgi:gliding motility-associated-like protein